MRPLTVGSLFSGVGGFDLAAERVGVTVAWQSEIEPYACRVLAHRFAGVPNLGDIAAITDAPPVDIITFGFPCQDLSVAGKRAGMGGARSGLFFEAIRIIERVRPAIAVAENVPGLLSSNRGRDLAAVLGALADIGALDIGWRVLDAQHFGVPQRRRRVFIVADFVGRRAAQILALAEGGDGDSQARRATGQRLADTLTVGANQTSGFVGEPVECVAPCVTRRHGKGTDSDASDSLIVANALTASNGHHGHSSPRGDGSDNLVVADLAQITSKANRSRVEGGLPSSTLAAESQMVAFGISSDALDRSGEGADGSAGARAGLGIVEDASPALRERHPNAVGGSFGVRRLTPVECERLQGFPDAWTCLHDHPQPCDCPDGVRYRCLGNAVVAPVAKWLLGRIAEVLS